MAQSTIETGLEIRVDHIEGNTVDGEFDEGDFNEYNEDHNVQADPAILIDHPTDQEPPMTRAAGENPDSGALSAGQRPGHAHNLGLEQATMGAGIDGATNAVDKMQHNEGDIAHDVPPSNDGYTKLESTRAV